MKVIRYEVPVSDWENYPGSSWDHPGVRRYPRPWVFLAGPTVRGNQGHLQPSWRFAAIEEFSNREFTGTLIVPEFTDLWESDKGREDIPLWEYEGLERSDVIMFWIPRTRELIGLTTNFEFGYWMRKRHETIVYGRPDDAYRVGYLDILWKKDASVQGCLSTALFPVSSYIYNTLGNTVDATMRLLKPLTGK